MFGVYVVLGILVAFIAFLLIGFVHPAFDIDDNCIDENGEPIPWYDP